MDYRILINEFERPKAKIDFIKLALPPSIKSEIEGHHFLKMITNPDSIKAPKKWRGPQDNHFTIHDPFLRDLQFLIDEHPNTEILSLEIAVDFSLKDGSNDPVRLAALHSWLKINLFPQRHKGMRTGYRKYYEEKGNTRKRDTLKTSSGDSTIYWMHSGSHEQVRLYIKTLDNKKPIELHSVRLEVTLSRGGCQRAKLFWMGTLPRFISGMRRYLSPFLNVAKGIKPQVKRVRSKKPIKALKAASAAAKEQSRVERHWKSCGAAWAAKHRYKIIPDAETNRLIGRAIGELRESLGRLKLTGKVRDDPDFEPLKRRMDTEH